MKKNFFKKLSFVLALAMIVTALAPAAGAFAAEDLHLNSTKKYLHLAGGEQGANDFNFNVHGDKQKGYQYDWTSSDEAVATVESNGVTTATGKGTATITVDITDKDGADVDSLSATVTVRDNIKTITEIYMQTAGTIDLAKLAVAKDYDFGRKYETYSGSKTATSGITRWTVTPATGATITDAGVFNATVAGKYTITANAFQSVAKYDEWKVAKDPASTLITATKPLEVTVVAGVVKTQQTDLDSFKVTFDSDMSKTLSTTTAVLYQILNDKDITTGAEKIKTITFDATGKEATFDVLAQFSAGVTYKLVSGDLVATFKAAATDISNVTAIALDDFTVNVDGTAANMLTSVKGLNADGVVIKTGADADFASLLTFAFGGDVTKGFVSGSDCYIYTVGYSTTVTATFDNWVYDDAQKKYVEVKVSDAGIATGIQPDTSLRTGSISFVLQPESNDPAITVDTTGWNTTFSLPAGDPEFNIRYRYQTNTITDGTYIYAEDAALTFKTDNPDKLLVFGTHMVPIATGTAVVLVLNADGKTVTAFTVTITPARTFVGASADVSSVSLGNSIVAEVVEDRTFTITGKDSMTDTVDPTIVSTEMVNAPAGVDKATALVDFGVVTDMTATDKATLQIFGSNAGAAPVPGAYTLLVTVSAESKGVALVDTKQLRLNVIVLSAAVTTVTRWAPELSATSIDRKDIIYATAGVDPVIEANVYGYNAAGARVAIAPLTDFVITLQSNGAAFTHNVDGVANTFAAGFDNAGAWDLYAKGIYTVTYKAIDTDLVLAGNQNVFNKANGMVIGYTQFEVKDATTTACAIVTSSVVAADVTDVAGAVQAAFEFKVDGTEVDDLTGTWSYFTSDGTVAVAGTDGTGVVTAGSTLYIDHVTYTIAQAGVTTFLYTIDVKKTIAIK